MMESALFLGSKEGDFVTDEGSYLYGYKTSSEVR